ncbi:MTH865 family protein [Natronolimnobius baerhuensis]|uniref:MTH865-like family protein n=1 Tax=Natronolimnobius baerhuensis TaxID=253108 RepID=A0A202EDX2_9EURY|nr:MTH865 family protein [Natronolimnobius baerhuensis]OVE86200.1 hypothetical protein B2G88_05280 [Natronolimnobius baerhuensis]
MSAEDDLREQMIDAFKGASYPVSSPMDLVPALPDGPGTKFETGDFSMTAMELNTKTSGGDFPYDEPEPLVDDIIQDLKDQNEL